MWELVKKIQANVMQEWHKPDKGIWEIRGEERHFVSSKVMCWVALDRGARIARMLGKYDCEKRWQQEAGAHPQGCAGEGLERGIAEFFPDL